MAYEVLARKWRPRNFNEVRGQEHVVRALRNALNLKRLHHAYLFSGTRGVGKTTIARILAKCLDCDQGPTAEPCDQCEACAGIDKSCYPDLIEIDAASRTGVDDMRELLENVPYAPTLGTYKIYLIDEVHMLSTSSFNALLKTLEEPPQHVKFFFATTHPKKIPVTILSRCLQFNLTRLEQEEIRKHLTEVLEKIAIAYEPEALRDLSLLADGSVRDALSLLDQAIAYGNGEIKLAETRAMLGLIAGDDVVGLLQSVVNDNLDDLFVRIDTLHKKVADFNSVLADLIVLLHEIAVWQAVQQTPSSSWFDEAAVKELASQITPEDVQLFYQLALNGKKEMPYLPDACKAFEMTLLRMTTFRPVSGEMLAAGKPQATSGSQRQQASPAAASQAPAVPPTTNQPSPSAVASSSAEYATAKSTSDRASSPAHSSSPPPQPTPHKQTTIGQASSPPPRATPAAASQTPAVSPTTNQPSPSAVASSSAEYATTKSTSDRASSPAHSSSPPPQPTPHKQTSTGRASSSSPPSTNPADPNHRSKLLSFIHDLDQRQAIVDSLGLSGPTPHICKHAEFSLQADKQLLMSLEKDDWPLLTDSAKKKITAALRMHFGDDLQVRFEQSQRPLCNTLSIQDEAHRAAHNHAKEQAMHNDKTAKILRQYFDAQFISSSDRLP